MASISNVLLKSSLVVMLAMSCSVSGAIAAKSSPSQKPMQRHDLTNPELVEILRSAKVTDGSYSLSATQTGDELIVSTQQNPKFNENDTKVQGVLIAKTAFDVLPDTIQPTKILFHDLEGGTFNEVLINRTVIETYGKGLLDEKKLLGSLELEKKGVDQSSDAADSPLKVGAGPMEQDRMIMLIRIQYMKKTGANLSRPENEFAEAEKLAAANDHDGVKAKLGEIKNMLDEQRGALKSAQKTQILLDKPSLYQMKSGSGAQQSGHQPAENLRIKHNHIGYLLHFLKSKGVFVDGDQRVYDSTRTSNNPNIEPGEQKRLRFATVRSLEAKLRKLPPQDQLEFKNYEASMVSAYSANHNEK